MYQTQDYRNWVLFSKYHVPRSIKKLEGPVALYVDFYVLRDRDIDSGLKACLDGFNGRLYTDDKQIVELIVSKTKVSTKAEVKTVVECISLDE